MALTKAHNRMIEGSVFNVKDFGAVADGVTDDTAAIQAALDAAHALVINVPSPNIESNVLFPQTGGATVYIPAGEYSITSIKTYDNIALVGAGQQSTVLQSSFNGKVLYNDMVAGTSPYGRRGGRIENLRINGDRTKTSQCLIDLLRYDWARIEFVHVGASGDVGLRIRQGLATHLEDVQAYGCVGDGFVITEGIVAWDDTTPSNLPSNAVMMVNCHGTRNDGAGLKLTGRVNGTQVVGGAFEFNYVAAGNNAGYNIVVETNNYIENTFVDVWTEGPAEAHVYVNCTDNAALVKLARWRHFPEGTSGFVDRALIVVRGSVLLHECVSTSTSYKTIAGSNAPFRLTKATSSIRNWNSRGNSITNGQFIEDETGLRTGMPNNAFQSNYGEINLLTFHRGTSGNQIMRWFDETQSFPQVSVVPGLGIGFGDGTSGNPDVYIKRTAANTLGLNSGDFFDAGSVWNNSHLLLGAYHIWVDATGDLRIKGSAPTSDTDGTVVGTQS